MIVCREFTRFQQQSVMRVIVPHLPFREASPAPCAKRRKLPVFLAKPSIGWLNVARVKKSK
jgi:hypothetical protein